jgi:hypothetical protein
MRKIVRKNGKKILLDSDEDVLVYDSYHAHYARTGATNATRGIDLFAKELNDGTYVFYLLHWTKWQGESNYIEEIDVDEAQEFAEENFDQIEEELAEKLGLIDMSELQ